MWCKAINVNTRTSLANWWFGGCPLEASCFSYSLIAKKDAAPCHTDPPCQPRVRVSLVAVRLSTRSHKALLENQIMCRLYSRQAVPRHKAG